METRTNKNKSLEASFVKCRSTVHKINYVNLLSDRDRRSAASKLIVARQQSVGLSYVRGQAQHARTQVRVGSFALRLGHGGLEAGQVIVVGVVQGLNAKLHWDRQRNGRVGRANRHSELESIGARDQARVERRQKELLVVVADGEGNVEHRGVLDRRRRLLVSADRAIRLGGVQVHVGAGVTRVSATARNLFLLPRHLVHRQSEEVVGGDVVEARAVVVRGARTKVGKMLGGSSAKEGGGNQLGGDRVDLGRSSIDRIGDKLEVDAGLGEGRLVTVGRKHNGTGLGSGGSQLASLCRKQVLADGLGLGQVVALVAESNVERSILGGGGQDLDYVVAVENLVSSDTRSAYDSTGLDSVLDVSHLRSLVISTPITNRGGQTKVVVLDAVGFAVVVAGANRQLMGNDKVERNLVGLASLEDPGLGKIILGNRHAKLQERTHGVARVLLDKVETSGSNAGEDDVKVVKSNIAGRLNNGVAGNRRTRGVDLGGKVTVDNDVDAVLVVCRAGLCGASRRPGRVDGVWHYAEVEIWKCSCEVYKRKSMGVRPTG